jgi:hypothetical protein
MQVKESVLKKHYTTTILNLNNLLRLFIKISDYEH